MTGQEYRLITALDLYRSSSARLSQAVLDGVQAFGGHVKGTFNETLKPLF